MPDRAISAWCHDGGVTPGMSVYVHIPFCAKRCDYCDFATWTDRFDLTERYVDACIADIEQRGVPAANTIFFGGGTPSLLAGDLMARLLDAIPCVDGAEVTIECNPDTVSPELFASYVAHGVTRISLGVQSMVASTLRSLGRTHDPENVRRAVSDARSAGIEQINLDLIYGAAGETMSDWRATLDGAIALAPDHISAYALTIELGTPLDARIRVGEVAAPDDDDQAEKYRMTAERLASAGFERYEISNWAQPGKQCRHNQCYWTQGDYLGIGCAAHSHAGGLRWWNVRTPERYIAAVEEGTSMVAGHEELSEAVRAEEAFTLALRTDAGVCVAAKPAVTDEVDALADAGLCQARADSGTLRIVLTAEGAIVANDITARLLHVGAALPIAPRASMPAWVGIDSDAVTGHR